MSSNELQKLTAFRKQTIDQQQAVLEQCFEKYTEYINQIIAQETLVRNKLQKQFDECLRRIDAQIQNKIHFSAVMNLQCDADEAVKKRENRKRKAPTKVQNTLRKKQRVCLDNEPKFKLTNRRSNRFQTNMNITKYDKLHILHSNGQTSVHSVGDVISVFDKISKKAIHGKICVFYRANTDIDLVSDEGKRKLPNYIKTRQKRVLIDWGWNLTDIKQETNVKTLKRIIRGKVNVTDDSFYCVLNREVPLFDERNDELIKGIFVEDESSKYIGKSDVAFSTKYKFDRDKEELKMLSSYHRKGKKNKKKKKRSLGTNNNAKQKAAAAPIDKLKCLKQKRAASKNNDDFMNQINASLSTREMDQLNDYIHEYLVFHGYDKTLSEFERERINKSYKTTKIEHNATKTNAINEDGMRSELLHKVTAMFDGGDINGIFKLWNRYISKEILNSNAYAIKIECHLHIFKFVTKISKLQKRTKNNKMGQYSKRQNEIRSELGQYFNDNGQRLALCQDVLPYFSLPFIENAHVHPTFAKFYQSDFAHHLRSELIGFLLKCMDEVTVPKLHSVFAIAKKAKNKKDIFTDDKIIVNKQNDDNLTEILRTTSAFVNKMQYCLNHSLPPTSSMIDECKGRMAKVAAAILEERKEIDQIELRDSTGSIPAVQYDNDSQRALLNTMRHSLPKQTQINESNVSEIENFKAMEISKNVKPEPSQKVHFIQMDYDKIRKQLFNEYDSPKPEQTKLLVLLQSLRWRVTKLIVHDQKRKIIVEYIDNDIFECKKMRVISNLLKHPNKQIVETTLRLLNVISSFAIGRTYLLQLDHNKLVSLLSDILTTSATDDAIRMNSMGCLQKLSLRRELQDTMIEKGLIGWIMVQLNDELDDLSEYTVEYSTALLMNLTLRTKGKKQCQLNEQHSEQILMTLLKLLNSSFVGQIHTYVNGVLYSLLSEKVIHETAIKMDLVNKLNKCVLNKYDEPSFKQQIDYIVNLLSAPLNDLMHDDDGDNDDNSEGSNEDYSENEDYEEYDVNELGDYLKENQEEKCNYAQGDQFLIDHYQQSGHASISLKKRPMTPQNMNDSSNKMRFSSFVSPTKIDTGDVEAEELDPKTRTPRKSKCNNDDEYRKIFGQRHRMERTPPFRSIHESK